MSDDYVWDNYGFVYNSVLFIPNKDWPVLYKLEWEDINSNIESLL